MGADKHDKWSYVASDTAQKAKELLAMPDDTEVLLMGLTPRTYAVRISGDIGAGLRLRLKRHTTSQSTGRVA